MPISVFLGLSVLELGPMYATDVRQTDVRQKHRLMPLPCGGGGITNLSTGLVEQSTAAEHLEVHHYIARTLAISNGAALHPNSLFIVSLINHQIVFNSKNAHVLTKRPDEMERQSSLRKFITIFCGYPFIGEPTRKGLMVLSLWMQMMCWLALGRVSGP